MKNQQQKNKNDIYNTGLKIGDWVKAKHDDRCVLSILNECECKIFKIIFIYKGEFAIAECYNQTTFEHHLKGFDMKDIEKVEFNG